jgi:hypothetical protein
MRDSWEVREPLAWTVYILTAVGLTPSYKKTVAFRDRNVRDSKIYDWSSQEW